MSWAAGGEAELRGGSSIAIGEAHRGLRLDRGHVVLRCRDVPIDVERGETHYTVRGAEIRASPNEIESLDGETEILTPSGERRVQKQGESQPWPK